MPQPIQLYFDKVSNGGRHGQTFSGEKILFNLKAIGGGWFDAYTDMLVKENKATIFVPTGRFLSAITASLDLNEKNMNTFDLLDNLQMAKHFAAQSLGNNDIFLGAWKLIEYKKDYNKFILVEGEIPVQQGQSA
jgi:hypothetical protein